LPMLYCH